MSRCRSKIGRIVAIAWLSALVASATVPCAAWAKGDHGDGKGDGSAGGGDHNGNGNGNGGDHNGNGNGNGGGPAGGGSGHGGAVANGGVQANVASAPSGAAVAAVTTNLELGGADQALASNFRLSRAVVALNATSAALRPPPHVGVDSRIQQMAAYDRAMLHALGMPDRTPTQRAARDRAIAGARIHLAAATSRRLNPVAVSRIDSLLGLPTTNPALGVQ
jgi:hypothetical protein